MLEIKEFAVPFFGFEWDEHEKHQHRLKEICHILEEKKSSSGVAPNAKTVYESAFNFLNIDDPSVQALAGFINKSIWQAASKANEGRWPAGARLAVSIHESWCHITRSGEYHDRHNHGNSSWSAIYYLDVGDSDNDNKNGLTRSYNDCTSSYNDLGTRWNSDLASIDIKNKSGLVLVFPSFIWHSQPPYIGEKNRYVIPVNSKIIEVPDDRT